MRYNSINNIHDAEFSIYSQWGEDGIIEYVLQSINDSEFDNKFVEFGVQGYGAPNTKFLLKNRNWEGLLMDGSKDSIDSLKDSNIYWKYNMKAIQRFITKENINKILKENDYTGNVGLLSIDIDGNDYWIWEEIEVASPIIVIIEYNSVFGNEHPITIPYQSDFVRSDAHHSCLYFGASLPALTKLANEKGYKFLGCNSNGNNAFFIRDDIQVDIDTKSVKDGWVKSKFRESRDENGNLNYLRDKERVEEIEDMSVYHIAQEKERKIRDLRPLY